MSKEVSYDFFMDVATRSFTALLGNTGYTETVRARKSLEGKSATEIMKAVARDALEFSLVFIETANQVWERSKNHE